jgi:threonine/homoserine/homoserine lactone efflux protein
MDGLLPIALVTFVAAGTPGPNNLLLLRVATIRGVRAALPAAAGMLLGGWALLAMAWFGLMGPLSRVPALRSGLVLLGSAWLSWIALRMIAGARTAALDRDTGTVGPANAGWILMFQFANPKAWVFVLVLAAAARDLPGWMLFALYAGVTTVCSLAWILGGGLLSPALSSERRKFHFELWMGVLLALSAFALPFTL